MKSISDIATLSLDSNPYTTPVKQDSMRPDYITRPLLELAEKYKDNGEYISKIGMHTSKQPPATTHFTIKYETTEQINSLSTPFTIDWYKETAPLIHGKNLRHLFSMSEKQQSTFLDHMKQSFETTYQTLAHLGANKCFNLAIEHFWWPKMQAEYKQYVASC